MAMPSVQPEHWEFRLGMKNYDPKMGCRNSRYYYPFWSSPHREPSFEMALWRALQHLT